MNCKHKCWTIVPLVLIGIAAAGWVVMALWNWLIPALIAGGKEIDYVQALGLLLLSRILFGGLRGHGCHGRWHRWERMTPEEREKFKTGVLSCCGKREQADASRGQND